MIDTSFLSQLHRFSLVVNKRVTSNYAGSKRSIAVGGGLVFKDYRIYAPGDDIRAVDWKVYARTDDLYLKTYEEERNLVVHVIVDHSKSMDFGKKLSKFDFASMIGVGFAYLALKDNEKFQFSTFSNEINVFKPKRGLKHLGTMVDYLNKVKPKGESKLFDSIDDYKKFITSRSMIILLSDFLINIEEIKRTLSRLGKHDIKVIQVLDPIEKDLDLSGDYKLKDSETNDMMKTYVSRNLKNKYKSMLDDHTDKISDVCSKLGINFYQFTTDIPIFDAFYDILK
ncbi:MAG: DUF58 domain-containing protein [Candidatus Woesearchaeota archaeon]